MKNKKKSVIPFAERHPKLNSLLGFFILIVILGTILLCGIWFGKKTGDFLLWLVETVSKMDVVIIVALITGTVSLTGVILSSIVSKIIEHKKSRQEYLAKKREVPYGQFVDMIYKLQEDTKNTKTYSQQEMMDDLSKFSKEITLWGSPNVVKKWVKFRELSINSNNNTDKLFIMEDIMNEMRKDLGLKKVKKGNLLAFFINDIKDFVNKK